MQRIVLTGSSGFIGSHFREDYGSQLTINTFSFLKDSLSSLSLDTTDAIIHLAGLVHQMGGAKEEAYIHDNVDNTLNLAKKAKEAGVKHFIFMSTVKVYGEENSGVYTENSPCIAVDMYGKSKHKAEEALLLLEDENFTVSIIRTPIVYGEGVKANILKLIGIVDSIKILPFGNISNKRSMVYVKNITYLIFTLITQKKSGIFLASDDTTLSTSEFIQSIAQALNKKTLLFNPYILAPLLHLVKNSIYKRLYLSLHVNNQQTKTILSLKNPYSTQEGIKRTVLWYKAR